MIPLAVVIAIAIAGGLVLLRAVLSLLVRHQVFTVPRLADGEGSSENPLYRKAVAYVGSLPSLDESERASLFSSGRSGLFLRPDPGQPVADSFLGAPVTWTAHPDGLSLRLRRRDRPRVLRPYLQHVESVAEDVQLRRRDVSLFTASNSGWVSVPLSHPATFETVAMDPEAKKRVRVDLEGFLSGRAYYHRLGRVWRRSYLLHGPPGTGKSTFVAAMAKFLRYDVYQFDPSNLLLQTKTTPRSIILVEDLDRHLGGEKAAEMLNFMDGISSACGEERVMVYTVSSGCEIDAAALRPGRVDVHVRFPMCDFTAFKSMASSYLGIKDHKLYGQVEEGFHNRSLSPADVGEIMIANRGSPTRAIKSVITALQKPTTTLLSSASGRRAEETEVGLGFGKDATIREFRKLYGLIKMRGGSRKEGMELAPPNSGTLSVQKDGKA